MCSLMTTKTHSYLLTHSLTYALNHVDQLCRTTLAPVSPLCLDIAIYLSLPFSAFRAQVPHVRLSITALALPCADCHGMVFAATGWSLLPRDGPCYHGMVLAATGWSLLPRNGPCSHGMVLAATGWSLLPRDGPCSHGMILAATGWPLQPRDGPCSHGMVLAATGWSLHPRDGPCCHGMVLDVISSLQL